jgi:hypothetical protein
LNILLSEAAVVVAAGATAMNPQETATELVLVVALVDLELQPDFLLPLGLRLR